MKSVISHYYSHIYRNRSAESTAWSRSSVFSESPCFHHSVNLDQCQTISTFFFKDILQFYIESCEHVFLS